MAKRRRSRKQQEDTLVDLVEAREQAQNFFERNQLMIIGVVAALALIIGGYLAYKMLYLAPKEKQAIESMYRAEFQFARDSFALALENPGQGHEGFLDIIDNYGGTKTANMAKYYAGVSYLNLGRYDAAIDYLKAFNANGSVLPVTKYGALGDAYAENGDIDQALSNYRKASRAKDNEFLTPHYLKKLGMLLEREGDRSGAEKAYGEIKTKYPKSLEAQDIEKYIRRVQS